MFLKKNIPNEPFLKLWMADENDNDPDHSPFGKPCMFCIDVFTPEDHAITRPITSNHFLRLDFNTPDRYACNIVTCGATFDRCFESMRHAVDHSRHFAHRMCYETYIRNNTERYVICPFVRAEFSYVDGYPLQFLANRKRVYLTDDTFEQRMAPENAKSNDLLPIDVSWMDQNRQYLMNLSERKRNALYAYTRWFYIPVNEGLRSHHITELALFIVRRMISVLNKAEPYPQAVCFYRAVSQNYADSVLSKLRIGDIIETKGFNSQTIRYGAAEAFGSNIMVLCYPAGTKLILLQPISQHPREYEFLTYPNQLLLLVSKKPSGKDFFFYFDVQARVVDVNILLAEKMLYISYNYHKNYDEIHSGLDHIFEDEFGVVRNGAQMLIYNIKLMSGPNNRQYCIDMVSDTPANLRILQDLKLLRDESAYEAAIRSDVDMFDKSRMDTLSPSDKDMITRALEDAADEGWIGVPDVSYPLSVEELIAQNQREINWENSPIFALLVNHEEMLDDLPRQIVTSPVFLLAFLHYLVTDTEHVSAKQLYLDVESNAVTVLFELQELINVSIEKNPQYLQQFVDVYLKLIKRILLWISKKVHLKFSDWKIPDHVYLEIKNNQFLSFIDLLETIKNKNVFITDIFDHHITPDILIRLIHLNVKYLRLFNPVNSNIITDKVIEAAMNALDNISSDDPVLIRDILQKLSEMATIENEYYYEILFRAIQKFIKGYEHSIDFNTLSYSSSFYEWIVKCKKKELLATMERKVEKGYKFVSMPKAFTIDVELMSMAIYMDYRNVEFVDASIAALMDSAVIKFVLDKMLETMGKTLKVNNHLMQFFRPLHILKDAIIQCFYDTQLQTRIIKLLRNMFDIPGILKESENILTYVPQEIVNKLMESVNKSFILGLLDDIIRKISATLMMKENSEVFPCSAFTELKLFVEPIRREMIISSEVRNRLLQILEWVITRPNPRLSPLKVSEYIPLILMSELIAYNGREIIEMLPHVSYSLQFADFSSMDITDIDLMRAMIQLNIYNYRLGGEIKPELKELMVQKYTDLMSKSRFDERYERIDLPEDWYTLDVVILEIFHNFPKPFMTRERIPAFEQHILKYPLALAFYVELVHFRYWRIPIYIETIDRFPDMPDIVRRSIDSVSFGMLNSDRMTDDTIDSMFDAIRENRLEVFLRERYEKFNYGNTYYFIQ